MKNIQHNSENYLLSHLLKKYMTNYSVKYRTFVPLF